MPDTPSMRQILSCTMMSIRIDTIIAKAKAAFSWSVKTVVWVRNPGPMAEVAIRKAAPISTLTADSFFSLIFSYLLWMMDLTPHLYTCKKVAEEIRRARKSKNAKKRLSGCVRAKRRKRRAVYAACEIARAARSAKPHGRKTQREVKAGRFMRNR